MADKDISKLPVKNKREGTKELFLVRRPYERCKHYDGPFELDEDAGKVHCLECQEEVSPIFVLKRLMQLESRWMRSHNQYHDEQSRLAKRSRTTCDHCGKMTKISRS